MYEARLARLYALMEEKKVDAALISKREDFIYFSGFNGSSAYLLLTPSTKYLLTDSRYMEQAQNQTKGYTIVDHKTDICRELESIAKSEEISSIGVETAFVSHDTYQSYVEKKIVKDIVPLSNNIDKLRICKDEKELELIKRAVEIADNAFAHVIKYIKPGVTELDIASEIEYYMKKNGSRKPSFDTIVASGKRSSLPHGVASDKKVEKGDGIILDFGAVFEDYCSDMTRTVFVGKPDDELVKIYNIVREAQEKAARELSKGMTGKEADFIARQVIVDHGYGNRFGHGLGHGVGLEIHESPTLSPRGELAFDNNMVVTVEPGIYIPEFGGVRIEDMIVIKDNEPMILTSSTKDLLIL